MLTLDVDSESGQNCTFRWGDWGEFNAQITYKDWAKSERPTRMARDVPGLMIVWNPCSPGLREQEEGVAIRSCSQSWNSLRWPPSVRNEARPTHGQKGEIQRTEYPKLSPLSLQSLVGDFLWPNAFRSQWGEGEGRGCLRSYLKVSLWEQRAPARWNKVERSWQSQGRADTGGST